MALEVGLGRPTGVDEDSAPQFYIVNNVNNAAAPPHEDGPVGAQEPQPFPGRVIGSDRAASAGS